MGKAARKKRIKLMKYLAQLARQWAGLTLGAVLTHIARPDLWYPSEWVNGMKHEISFKMEATNEAVI